MSAELPSRFTDHARQAKNTNLLFPIEFASLDYLTESFWVSVVMAYRYFVDQEVNCIFVRHTGATSRGEITDLLGQVFEDDKFYGNMNILRDMREAELSDEFEYSAFKKWADESIGVINKKLGKCRVAWVLGSRDDFARVHRIKHIFRFKFSSVEIDGFRKLESALSWLDIPSDYDINKFDRDG